MFIESELDKLEVRITSFRQIMSFCSETKVGKKKVTSTEKKAEVLTKAFDDIIH